MNTDLACLLYFARKAFLKKGNILFLAVVAALFIYFLSPGLLLGGVLLESVYLLFGAEKAVLNGLPATHRKTFQEWIRRYHRYRHRLSAQKMEPLAEMLDDFRRHAAHTQNPQELETIVRTVEEAFWAVDTFLQAYTEASARVRSQELQTLIEEKKTRIESWIAAEEEADNHLNRLS